MQTGCAIQSDELHIATARRDSPEGVRVAFRRCEGNCGSPLVVARAECGSPPALSASDLQNVLTAARERFGQDVRLFVQRPTATAAFDELLNAGDAVDWLPRGDPTHDLGAAVSSEEEEAWVRSASARSSLAVVYRGEFDGADRPRILVTGPSGTQPIPDAASAQFSTWWGYRGAAPAQSARRILEHALRGTSYVDRLITLSPRFAVDIVSRLPQYDTWVLPREAVLQWAQRAGGRTA